MSEEEKEIISTSNHLLWTIFVRTLNTENEYSKVLTYINIRLIRLQFVLRRDIFKYKDINLLFFFSHGIMYFLINIYLDDHQFALKYLKNTEVNLNNILIIIGDFNIRNNDWDLVYIHYSTHADTLRIIADSFDLEHSLPINQVLTHYVDNS